MPFSGWRDGRHITRGATVTSPARRKRVKLSRWQGRHVPIPEQDSILTPEPRTAGLLVTLRFSQSLGHCCAVVHTFDQNMF